MTEIRSRAQWGARYARGAGPAPLPAEFLFLHHSVTDGIGDAAVRRIEQVGQDRFRAGISYTFAVDQTGTIYEGHGVERRGTHTRGLNSRARAIVAIGNFDEDTPTSELLKSVARLVVYGHRQRWWAQPALTGGHRDAPGASTACPGQHLYGLIPAINRRAAQILAGTDPEEFTMDAAAEERFDRLDAEMKGLKADVGRLLADAKTKTSATGAIRGALGRIEARLRPSKA